MDHPMKKTYANIISQIEALKAEAEKLRRTEVSGVIKRIKDAIAAYMLTPADLGFGAAASKLATKAATTATGAVRKKPGPKPGSKRNTSAKPATTKSAGSPAARFRDSSGNTWVGRGPRPRWLREALAAGKALKDFAV